MTQVTPGNLLMPRTHGNSCAIWWFYREPFEVVLGEREPCSACTSLTGGWTRKRWSLSSSPGLLRSRRTTGASVSEKKYRP